jgi:hypothetical protein
MDATAQNASRLAVQTEMTPGAYTASPLLVVTSAIESGIWQREFRLFSYGICVEIPQGRVTAFVRNIGAAFAFRSTFGEGVVSKEWQTLSSGAMPLLDKRLFNAPPYARRLRVSVMAGGPFLVDLPGLSPLAGGTVSLLPPPGGQTAYECWAPEVVQLTNNGPADSVATIEWEILG